MTNKFHAARSTLRSLALAAFLTSAGSSSQAQEQAKPSAQPPSPAVAPVRQMPPDQKAYNDAMMIPDAGKKIAALEKFLVDFPKSGGTTVVQRELLRAIIKAQLEPKDRSLRG